MGRLKAQEPAYQAVNLVARWFSADLWFVNLVCAIVFAFGLFRFASCQPQSYLGILVAVPYLVIVVAMGYTRQGASIGVVMAGLASYLSGRSAGRYALFVAAATAFHRSAIVALPIVVFTKKRGKFLTFLASLAVMYGLFSLFVSSKFHLFVTNYLDFGYSSKGAGVRIAMNAIPSLLYLFLHSRMQLNEVETKVYRNMAIASLACAVLLAVTPSSTAVDRIALYFIPVQIAFWARAPQLFTSRPVGTAAVIGYSAVVQLVWLVFATHAKYWIPYRLWPLT
jgi:hypothetical protein